MAIRFTEGAHVGISDEKQSYLMTRNEQNIAKAEARLLILTKGEDVATKLAGLRGKVPTETTPPTRELQQLIISSSPDVRSTLRASDAGKSANSTESQAVNEIFKQLMLNDKWMPFSSVPRSEPTEKVVPRRCFGEGLYAEECGSNQDFKCTREFSTPSGTKRSVSGIPDYYVCTSISFNRLKPAPGCGLGALRESRNKLRIVLVEVDSGNKGAEKAMEQLAVTMWCYNAQRESKCPLYGIVFANRGLIYPLKLTTDREGREQIHTDGCLSSVYLGKLCCAMLSKENGESECWDLDEKIASPTKRRLKRRK